MGASLAHAVHLGLQAASVGALDEELGTLQNLKKKVPIHAFKPHKIYYQVSAKVFAHRLHCFVPRPRLPGVAMAEIRSIGSL